MAMTTHTVRVRLRWSDGRIETLPKEIDATATVINRQNARGLWHSFRESDEIDGEGYVIFPEEPGA
jgi:hypothetical protein